MRHVGFIALALFAVACGPDPNARLPGAPTPAKTGGTAETGYGGAGAGGNIPASGGTTVIPPGSGGAAGSSPFGNGGAGGSTTTPPGSGGAAGSSPVGSGGSSARGGAAGGTTSTGSGGSTGSGSGGITTPVQGGASGKGSGGTTTPAGQGGAGGTAGAEPCSPATDVSGTASQTFNSTSEVCLRTQDDITGTNWNCSSFTGWILKVNGQATTCGSALPSKANGFFYFNAIPGTGAQPWAAIYWFNAVVHPGPYPPWPGSASTDSDASVNASIDGAAPATAVDSET